MFNHRAEESIRHKRNQKCNDLGERVNAADIRQIEGREFGVRRKKMIENDTENIFRKW